MNSTPSNQSGCSFPQRLVNQQPSYDKKAVMDRRLKVMRPSRKQKKNNPRFL